MYRLSYILDGVRDVQHRTYGSKPSARRALRNVAQRNGRRLRFAIIQDLMKSVFDVTGVVERYNRAED